LIYALKIACCIGVSVVVITAAIALLPAAAAGAGAVATVEASTTAVGVVATVEASTMAVVGAEVCGCVATGAEVAAGIGYTKILIGSAVTIGGISSAGTISHYK
jgi:hypothetical protein